MQDDRRHFILTGELKAVLWQSSWPAIVAILLFGLNNFLDTLLVGHLIGSQALAAVGLSYPLSQLMMGFARLIGTGSATAYSIWLGADQQEKLSRLFGSLNMLSLLSTLIIALPGYIFAEFLLKLSGAPPELIDLAAQYFRVTLIGSFFWIHGFSINMLLRGEGKMKTAALMIGFGLLIDLLLKPLFISVFNWGVAGAAWATNAGMFIYSALGIWYFSQKKKKNMHWQSLDPDKKVSLKILSLGLPEMLFSILSVLQGFVILNALTSFSSTSDLIFFTVVNRFYLFLLTPLFGLMRGLQPVAGINYGFGNARRAQRALYLSVMLGGIIILPFWVMTMFWPQTVITAFMPGVAASTAHISNLRIYFSIIPLLPLIVMALAYFPAINQAKRASLLAVFRQIGLYLPVMIILPVFFGVDSIYWGSAAIEIIVLCVTIFQLGMMKKS